MRSVVMDELAGRSPALEQMEPYLFDAPDERRREVVAMIRALRALTRDLGLRVHPMRVPDPDRVRFYRPIPSDLVVDEGREPFLAFAKRSDTQAFSVGLAFDAFVRDGDASMPARPSAVGHELAHMISAHGIVLPRSAGGNLGIRSGFKMPGTGSTVRFDMLNEAFAELVNLSAARRYWEGEPDLDAAVGRGASINYPWNVVIAQGLVAETAKRHDAPERVVLEGVLRDLISGEDDSIVEVLAPYACGSPEQRAALGDLMRSDSSLDLGALADLSGRLGLGETAELVRSRSVVPIRERMEQLLAPGISTRALAKHIVGGGGAVHGLRSLDGLADGLDGGSPSMASTDSLPMPPAAAQDRSADLGEAGDEASVSPSDVRASGHRSAEADEVEELEDWDDGRHVRRITWGASMTADDLGGADDASDLEAPGVVPSSPDDAPPFEL